MSKGCDGEYEPPMGNFPGAVTDKLDGGYVTSFALGGPKFYSYLIQLLDG